VRLQVDDVCGGGRVRDRVTVIQKKTGRPVQFEITEQTRASIQDWLLKGGARTFPSRFQAHPHLSTRQYALLGRYRGQAGTACQAALATGERPRRHEA
jgi:hypothetical protein